MRMRARAIRTCAAAVLASASAMGQALDAPCTEDKGASGRCALAPLNVPNATIGRLHAAYAGLAADCQGWGYGGVETETVDHADESVTVHAMCYRAMRRPPPSPLTPSERDAIAALADAACGRAGRGDAKITAYGGVASGEGTITWTCPSKDSATSFIPLMPWMIAK